MGHRRQESLCGLSGKGLVCVGPAWDNAATQVTPFVGGLKMKDWKEDLAEWLRQDQRQREEQARAAEQQRDAVEQNRRKAIEFVDGVVVPAFAELEKGLPDLAMIAHVERGEKGTSILITVQRLGEGVTEGKSFQYAINASYDANGITPEVVTPGPQRTLQKVDQTLTASDIVIPIEKADIIEDFMRAFKKTFSFAA
jgi:hypothetical protein